MQPASQPTSPPRAPRLLGVVPRGKGERGIASLWRSSFLPAPRYRDCTLPGRQRSASGGEHRAKRPFPSRIRHYFPRNCLTPSGFPTPVVWRRSRTRCPQAEGHGGAFPAALPQPSPPQRLPPTCPCPSRPGRTQTRCRHRLGPGRGGERPPRCPGAAGGPSAPRPDHLTAPAAPPALTCAATASTAAPRPLCAARAVPHRAPGAAGRDGGKEGGRAGRSGAAHRPRGGGRCRPQQGAAAGRSAGRR